MIWSIYEIINIFELRLQIKVKNDHRSKFPNLSNWKEEAWKNQVEPVTSAKYRCDALPTELWSHTFGARSIYWVHSPVRSEMTWSIYEIIHIFQLRLKIKVKIAVNFPLLCLKDDFQSELRSLRTLMFIGCTRWNANRCYSLRTTYLIFETFQSPFPTDSLIFTAVKLFHEVIWARTKY